MVLAQRNHSYISTKGGTIVACIEMANLGKGCLWFTHDPLKEHLLFDSFCRQNSDYITNEYLKTIQIIINNFSAARFFDSPIRRLGHQMVGHHDVHFGGHLYVTSLALK